VAKVVNNRAGKVGQDCVLLQLVGHNRCVGLSRLADRKSLLTVLDGVPEAVLGAGKTHGGDAESATQETVGNLEESIAAFLNVADEFSLFVNICQSIKHINARDLNMTKCKPGIVDTIQTDFHAHILDGHTSAWFHVIVADGHDEGVHALILVPDDGLSEDDRVIGVASTVCNPELLGEHGWRVNSELLSRVVVVGSRLHFRRIVAVAELSEAEAAHVLEAVDLSHDGQVALRVETGQGTSEKIELHGELGGEGAVDLGQHLVGRENVMGVSLKVKN